MERARRHLVADLRPMTPPAIDLELRHPAESDAEALAVLMLDAYTGTIDYGGETLDDARTEISSFFTADDPRPMLAHSFVAPAAEAAAGLAGAILVGHHEGLPFISYVMTAAAHKGRGLGTALTVAAMESLRAAGERRVHLWVTAGNDPAERIYERLGFSDAPT